MKMVHDQSCSCEALVLPRRGVYSMQSFTAAYQPTAQEDPGDLASLARKLQSSDSSPIYLGGKYGSDVLGASWSKDIESPYGSFSLNLKPSNLSDGSLINYMKKIAPGDFILLFMDNQKIWSKDKLLTGTLLCMGIIDRVSNSVVVDGDGAEHTSYALTGRDFGALFTDTSTVFDQAFSFNENQYFSDAFFQAMFATQTGGPQSPLQSVLTVLNIVFNANLTSSALLQSQWRLQAQPGSVDDPSTIIHHDNASIQDEYSHASIPLISLLNLLNFTQELMFGYTTPDPFGFAQASNVWSLLDSFCNRCVNEMFIDVRDYSQAEAKFISGARAYRGVSQLLTVEDQTEQELTRTNVAASGVFATLQSQSAGTSNVGTESDAATIHPANYGAQALALVMRQRPYDHDTFMMLPQVDVNLTEVEERDFGYALNNVVNFFRIRSPVLNPMDQELIYGIRVNVDSVYRYGLRRCEPETRYFFAQSDLAAQYGRGPSQGNNFSDLFNWYIGLLSTWYAANDQMLEGQITLKHFRPDIRVGVRMRLTAPNNESFNYGQGNVPYLDFYVEGVQQHFSATQGASRTILQLRRGIYPNSTGLAANLKWDPVNGSQIPDNLNTFARFNADGTFSVESNNLTVQNTVDTELTGGND